MTRHHTTITTINNYALHSINDLLLAEPGAPTPASPPMPLLAAGNGVGAVAEQFTKTGETGGRHD